jgi:hypothetical protein
MAGYARPNLDTQVLDYIGARRRDRTADIRLVRATLYQLSYARIPRETVGRDGASHPGGKGGVV